MERPDGREIAKPVELRVMVGDANDNRPTFPQMQYHTVVKELATKGYTHNKVLYKDLFYYEYYGTLLILCVIWSSAHRDRNSNSPSSRQ